MPDEWNTVILCPIFMKGDPGSLTLLNIGHNVFIALLMDRISPYATDIVEEYQCGFK